MVFVLTGNYKTDENDIIGEEEKRKIRDLLANAKINEAIDLLLENIPLTDSDLNNQVLIQKSRYMDYKNKVILGLEVDNTVKNKIVLSILEIINGI